MSKGDALLFTACWLIKAQTGIHGCTPDESILDPRFHEDDKREQTHEDSPITLLHFLFKDIPQTLQAFLRILLVSKEK